MTQTWSANRREDESMAEIIQVGEDGSNSFLSGSSCAFGVFDGVHRGHRFLISRAIETAAETGGASVALTFSIDPDELFAADRLVKLMTNEERLLALAESGVDAVAVLPFDRGFASLSPDDFLDRTFGGNVPAHLHVGEGFRFGSRGSGDARTLEGWGNDRGMRVSCHSLLQLSGAAVSSTRIRGLLANGRVDEAEVLLGRALGSV